MRNSEKKTTAGINKAIRDKADASIDEIENKLLQHIGDEYEHDEFQKKFGYSAEYSSTKMASSRKVGVTIVRRVRKEKVEVLGIKELFDLANAIVKNKEIGNPTGLQSEYFELVGDTVHGYKDNYVTMYRVIQKTGYGEDV